MSDAIRNVTILLNIKPGDISKPDMSWLTQGAEDAKNLTKDINSLNSVVEGMNKQTNEMVETQEKAAKVNKDIIESKKDLIEISNEVADTEKKNSKDTTEQKKKDHQEYMRWLEGQMRQQAEKQEQLDREMASKRTEIQRQEAERAPFVIPTPNPNMPLREPGTVVPGYPGGMTSRQQPKPFDFSAISGQIEQQMEENFRAFEEYERKKTELAIREAAERAEAAKQAEESLPKHWRNTLLNAGQATASVARYVSHMRLLKSVAGDSLEDVAKRLMTIQSRVEMIAASTSAFTNFGTMLDGMQQVGKATEQVVAQQIAMGKQATLNQSLIMNMGRTAAELAPLVAPAQIAFTTLTGLVVGLDIAMDLMGDSAMTAREKQESMLKLFDQQLDRVMAKMNEESKILQQQNSLLQTQWEIRELLAGDAGLGSVELGQRNAEMRAQQDAEAEQKIRQETDKLFSEKMTDAQKARQAEIDKTRKELDERIKSGEAWIAAGEADAMMMQGQEDLIRRRSENENRQRELDKETGKFIREPLAGADFKDGQIQNFQQFLDNAKRLPENERGVFLGLADEIVSDSNNKIVQQQRDAENRAKQAEQKAKQEAAEVERQQREMDLERATAERYSMADSQWRLDSAREEMQRFQDAATPEDREQAARTAREMLQGGNGIPNLLTPEMEAELGLGSAARPDMVISMMQDAATFDPDEENQYQEAIAQHNAAQVEARDQAKAMSELAVSLKKILEENTKQIAELRRAIENRDL